MTEKKDDGLFSCTNMCWLIGALVGFALWLVLMRNVGMNAVIALIIGAIAAFGLGWVLKNFFCTDQELAAPVATATAGAAVAATAASATTTSAEPEAETAVAEAEAVDTIVEEAAEDVVATDADIADLETLDAAVEAETVAEPVAVEETPPPAPAPKPKAKAKAAKPAAEPDATAEKKPRTMKAPRKAGADDLKLIKGVGPKLEGTLNELGFYHFDQISKWGDAEIAWVDNRLKFKGRITRDGWIEQAGILAAGGETEFSKRGKKA